MFLSATELNDLLQKEDEYINHLKNEWSAYGVMNDKAEHDLRMGKRTELLGKLEIKKLTWDAAITPEKEL